MYIVVQVKYLSFNKKGTGKQSLYRDGEALGVPG
jgi:hypothetical protein